jgi:hypothetical protein
MDRREAEGAEGESQQGTKADGSSTCVSLVLVVRIRTLSNIGALKALSVLCPDS